MALQLLYSDTLSPTSGTLTDRFSGATGFYIDAPSILEEIEIDVFLQVYIVTQAGESPRNYPLGKLKDGEIKLNETDTETIKSIPKEFLESGLEMAFLFLPSEAIPLDVWVVFPDCDLCEIKAQIQAFQDTVASEFDDIDDRLNVISTNINNRFDALDVRLTGIEAILQQILIAAGIDIVVPGSTGGTDTIAPVGAAATAENFFLFI